MDGDRMRNRMGAEAASTWRLRGQRASYKLLPWRRVWSYVDIAVIVAAVVVIKTHARSRVGTRTSSTGT